MKNVINIVLKQYEKVSIPYIPNAFQELVNLEFYSGNGEILSLVFETEDTNTASLLAFLLSKLESLELGDIVNVIVQPKPSPNESQKQKEIPEE